MVLDEFIIFSSLKPFVKTDGWLKQVGILAMEVPDSDGAVFKKLAGYHFKSFSYPFHLIR